MAKKKAIDDEPDAFDAAQIDFWALEYPRWMHKDGEQKHIEDADACAAAWAEGWRIHPTS